MKPKASGLLEKWLEKNNRSQQWLAAKVGVHQTTVRLWIQGSLPSIPLAAKLESVTGIAVGQWIE